MSAAIPLPEIAVLGALAASPSGLDANELVSALADVGVDAEEALSACEALVARGCLSIRGSALELLPRGGAELLGVHAAIERALDPSPSTPGMEECPSLPWLTTVQTEWHDALSLNYAVRPEALAELLPAPLEPEVFHGSAWVQVLCSRLREMRPQGVPALFGVDFHQVSYRAAVRYTGRHGVRRGGYFVRSETDHAVMRAVGNALVEFKFHDFEAARVSLSKEGSRLTFVSSPEGPLAETRVVLDVSPGQVAPPTSPWVSPPDLRAALVECYDAFGVDPGGYVYVLTIDRDPWREVFARPLSVSVPWMERGPLAGARLDSALHIPLPCRYRWRPLRRERLG
jgi:uncharacterized protein YqjF (DUF2071 family)